MKKSRFIITVTSRDRPGIVAGVTEAVAALEGNLSDLRQSVLRGYFTMILLAAFPEGTEAATVRRAVEEAVPAEVAVLPVEGEPVEDALPEHLFLLTAAGRDRAGLVARVSRFCADAGINILDLASRIDGERYTMMLLLDLSGAAGSLDDLREGLRRLAGEAGLEIGLRHYDIFRATNEI